MADQELNEFEVVEEPSKCWKVFATISKVCGIVSLATSLIPVLFGFVVGIPGIVFGALGAKTGKKTGLVLSIIGTIVSFVSFCAIFFVAGLLSGLEDGEELGGVIRSIATFVGF